MKVIVAGGTGFIGTALCERLQVDRHDVVALAWDQEPPVGIAGDRVRIVRWDGKNADPWARDVDGADAVINLVGENVSSGRWTQEKKERILRSRVDAALAVAQAVEQASRPPKVVIQGSAIGYYGRHGDEVLDETSGPGEGFFAEVFRETEDSVRRVQSGDIRLVIVRTGLVLGADGGVLPGLMRSFRRFLGGPNGSGDHWTSWVHIEDVVSAFCFLMDREDSQGAFNLTAPEHLRHGDLCRSLGKAMNRPSWFSTPPFWLRLRYGELADAVLLSGARVVPSLLLDAGFRFKYTSIDSALQQVVQSTG